MKHVFIELNAVTLVDDKFITYKKWVNMSRVQEVDPPEAFSDVAVSLKGAPRGMINSVLTMNIPRCFVALAETPEQVILKLEAANAQENDDGSR